MSQSNSNFTTKLKSFVITNQNSILTIAGVLIGLSSGVAAKRLIWFDQPVDPHMLRFMSLPGILYIRAFLLLIIPLLVASLATSLIANEEGQLSSSEKQNKNTTTEDDDEDDDFDAERNKELADRINPQRLLLVTLTFFSALIITAIVFAISMMTLFKPGVNRSNNNDQAFASIHTEIGNVSAFESKPESQIQNRIKSIEYENYQSDSVYNIFLNVFPNNLIFPLFATSYTQTSTEWPTNLTEIFDPTYVPQSKQKTINEFKPNMIGICTVSFMLGLLLKKLGPSRTRNIRHILAEVNLLVYASFRVLTRFMPFGMFLWMFSEGLKLKSISLVAAPLAAFFTLTTVIFLTWWCLVWPTIMLLFCRQNAFRLYRQILPAILMAFGTTSSAITLPVTIRCMESGGDDNNRLPKIFSRTILPLGMTVHMNGTSMFYPMVAMFVAQMKGVELDAVRLFVLGLFAFAMSVGASGAPSGGSSVVHHVAYAAVLGIDDPQDVLAFILPFEWIWERVRTATNITGDCVVSRCVEKLMTPRKHEKKVKNIEMSPL